METDGCCTLSSCVRPSCTYTNMIHHDKSASLSLTVAGNVKVQWLICEAAWHAQQESCFISNWLGYTTIKVTRQWFHIYSSNDLSGCVPIPRQTFFCCRFGPRWSVNNDRNVISQPKVILKVGKTEEEVWVMNGCWLNIGQGEISGTVVKVTAIRSAWLRPFGVLEKYGSGNAELPWLHFWVCLHLDRAREKQCPIATITIPVILSITCYFRQVSSINCVH